MANQIQTVDDLIEELKKQPGRAIVSIAIKQGNKNYPVHYGSVSSVLSNGNGSTRLFVYLPDNMHTVTKKQ